MTTRVYNVAGAWKLCNTLLPQAFSKVDVEQKAFLNGFQHATISLDGWSNNRMQSIYGYIVRRADGKVALLDLIDISDLKHTSEHLKGELQASFTVTWE